MKNDVIVAKCSTEQELIDKLLTYKLNTTTISNSERAIKEICTAVDSLKNIETGYRLLSITSNKTSLLHLIMKEKNDWYKYEIYTWDIEEKIEKGISAKIHEVGNESLKTWMEDIILNIKAKSETFKYTYDELIAYLITDSLTGYVINKKKFLDHCEFLSSAGKKRELNLLVSHPLATELQQISTYLLAKSKEKRDEIRSTIVDFAEKLGCEKLSLKISHNCIYEEKGIAIGKITKVIQNNNVRTYQLKIINFIPGVNKVKELTIISSVKAGVIGNSFNLSSLGSLWIAETRPNYYGEDTHLENFGRIPYNFIDEGRTIVGIPRVGSTYDIIIGADPKIEKDPLPILENVLDKYVDALTKGLTKLNGTKIVDEKNNIMYDGFEASVAKETIDTKPLQIRLKTLKKMIEEYQYIVQKQVSVGTDIKISDKVTYNHKDGKVSYNDFSISISDEMLKSRLFQTFEKYLITYYRGETSEQAILDDILNKIFEELKSRINSYSQENVIIQIVLNDKINIDLEIKTTKTKSRLLYLNGQRFNKNEVITVLREITCYRSQEEATRFISNVGKLGLSVYIGMTSGYETIIDGSTKLFRFKKLKGRSNYTLILDSIEIPLKGKELVNTLFSKFIGEHVSDFNKKIPKIVFESVENSADYIKYKFLIDSTYELFKARSQEFLNKKVIDVEGEFCKYYNTNGKRTMNAITLIGMSGHRYIIAYDNKDSYVFLDPELKTGEKNIYQNGKYVCMIDQSNIKSNIGYDTVISKLLALKNDSVIAETIYNLEEEINE